jgi:hypothetical protein
MKRLFLSVLFVLCLATSLSAAPIIPVSYTSNYTSGSYPDDTGTQLIDGLLNGLIPTVSLATPNAYNWVGWEGYGNPSLTFNFGAPVTINKVSIDMANWNPAGVYLPSQVKINSSVFNVTGVFPNMDRVQLTFSGTWSGQYLTLDLQSGGYWTFIDEVSFDGSQGVRNSVPEPSSLAYLAFASLAVIWLRTDLLRRQPLRPSL